MRQTLSSRASLSLAPAHRRAGRFVSTLCAAGLGAALCFGSAAARADAPNDSVLQAMKERPVVVQRSEGAEVEGTLVGFDAQTITILTKAGEPVNIPRSMVTNLRGAAAPAPTNAPTAPAQDAPQVAPTGTLVHIDTNDPEVKLYRLAGQSTVVAGNAYGVITTFEMMCTAPCDRPIDGSRGDSFFLSLNGFRLGNMFEIHDTAGTGQTTLGATIHRRPSRGLVVGGFTLAGVGFGLTVGAAVLAALGTFNEYDYGTASDTFEPKLKTDNSALAWGVTGAFAALTAGGIVMIVMGRGDYDLKIPTYGGLTLRNFALTPPVTVGSEHLPATGSLSFTF